MEKHLPPAAVKGFFSSKCSSTDPETEPRHCSLAALAHRHILSHRMVSIPVFCAFAGRFGAGLCPPHSQRVCVEALLDPATSISCCARDFHLHLPAQSRSTSTATSRAGSAQCQPAGTAPKCGISSWESRAGNFQNTPACFSISSQILVLQPPTPVKHISKSPSHLLYLRLA